nr:MAG TPA: hypothetical protein [Caudoviricetes sp.]
MILLYVLFVTFSVIIHILRISYQILRFAPQSFDFSLITKNRLSAVPAAGDITCRLNVNSVTQVYSIFLSAFIVYANYAKMST